MEIKVEMSGTTTAIGAIDIGGTKTAVGVVDDAGAVLTRQEVPTAASEGFDKAMQHIGSMLDAARRNTNITLRGIGIGCTGPVDPLTGEIGDVEFLPGWKGCNPVERLAKDFSVSVAMENDADVAVLGEAQWGAGKGRRNLICVTVGTGIGGGILFNGALYRGLGGAHPEIGHHVIDDSGPACFCGARGCWEVLASGPAMAKRLLREQQTSGSQVSHLTAFDICQLARDGDSDALREVAREGRYLGLGIANLITLYVPEAIVLTGSVMRSADLFMPHIREVVRQNCGLVPAQQVMLTASTLGGDAALLGAAVAWRHRNQKDKNPC
jgi:glucokinase